MFVQLDDRIINLDHIIMAEWRPTNPGLSESPRRLAVFFTNSETPLAGAGTIYLDEEPGNTLVAHLLQYGRKH